MTASDTSITSVEANNNDRSLPCHDGQISPDYRAPLYWIDSIDLDFQLQEPLTRVTAISRLRRNGEHNEPLVLDGEGLSLHSVSVDGVPSTQYEQGESTLTLFNLPAECVLTIVTLLDPAANTALEGLYKSGDAYCTQCEAEGFRRITYYPTGPTSSPVTAPASPPTNPSSLSCSPTATRSTAAIWVTAATSCSGRIPSPNRATCLPGGR